MPTPPRCTCIIATVNAPPDNRPEPPLNGDERATLLGFLRWQRATFEWKCAGLSPGELAQRGVEPSEMSLLGLLRHLSDVERGWFRRVMTATASDRRYRTADNVDRAFTEATADRAVVDAAWEQWRDEVAFADDVIVNAPSLDDIAADRSRGAISLRWILIHMIEEYARHNGHADLLRERIDGAVGE